MADTCITAPIDDPRDALRTALLQLEHSQADARPWALADAHRAVAQAYRRLGALPSALAMFEAALRWARAVGAGDQVVDLLCDSIETLAELAETQERASRGSGRPSRDRARDLLFEATGLATRVADPGWEVTVLLRLSDVLDRFGDRDDATVLQVRALQLTVGAASAATPPNVADASLLRRH